VLFKPGIIASALPAKQTTICWPNSEQTFKRWSEHQGTSNNLDKRDDSSQIASSRHYAVFHGIMNIPPIHYTFTVRFLEQLTQFSLYRYLWRQMAYRTQHTQINIENV